MTKQMPLEDFRAVRTILEPDDFAHDSEHPEPPPSDLVAEDTWHHLVSLPDDVAIRTSNHWGTTIKDLSELEGEFVEVCLAAQDLTGAFSDHPSRNSPMEHVLVDASDELQASIYNALTGYYRVAFSVLRNAVENLTVGLHLELSGDQATYRAWLSGTDLRFGWAADLTPKHPTVANLEAHFLASVGDDIFHQKSPPDHGGFARRLFAKLSKYTHGTPGHSHVDLWASNGPIFVPDAFLDWAVTYTQVLALSLILCKLAYPQLSNLRGWSDFTLGELFNQVGNMLRPGDDGALLFANLPHHFWE